MRWQVLKPQVFREVRNKKIFTNYYFTHFNSLFILKKELGYILTAVMFYTRIPCPQWIDHNPDDLNKATRYFPVIGWLVGGISFLSFLLFNFLLTPDIAILLSMVTGIFITGAFHEDGFADVCDGFGGGWTKEKILSIMKDSRSGAYGVTGLCSILVLKFISLQAIYESEPTIFLFVLLAAHAFSRFCAVMLMSMSRYVRENEDAKAKPLAKKISTAEILPAFCFGLIPLFLFQNIISTVLIILPLAGTLYLRWYYHKWIGGYTGDCLGAVQQIAEILFYLSILILWKFT